MELLKICRFKTFLVGILHEKPSCMAVYKYNLRPARCKLIVVVVHKCTVIDCAKQLTPTDKLEFASLFKFA